MSKSSLYNQSHVSHIALWVDESAISTHFGSKIALELSSMPQLCLLLMLKYCFAGEIMLKSPWNTKCAKSMQKDLKR